MVQEVRLTTDTGKLFSYLGKGHKLIEGQDKVSGCVKYNADLKLAGMLHLRPVLSPHAHASIVSLNLDAARLVPGVVAVLTDGDLCTRNTVINSRSSAVLAPHLERCDVQLHTSVIRLGLAPVDCVSLIPRLDLRTLPQFLLLFTELGR